MAGFSGIGDLIAPMSAALTSGRIGALPVPGVGAGNWLSQLFSNKAFLQLLGSAGLDISQGTGGKNTIAALTSLIGSQNFMKRFGDILGAGGDVKITSEGAKINIPAGGSGGTATATAGASGGAKGTTTPDILGTLSSVLGGSSPFSSSQTDVPVSDLAGLDPQTLAQGLGLELGAAQLKEKTFKDIEDAIYGRQLTAESAERTRLMAGEAETRRMDAETAQANALMRWVEGNRVSPLELPGVGQITESQFKSLPTDVQAYAYYVFDSKKNGRPVLIYDAWKNQEKPPQIYEIYKLSLKDPAFKRFYFQSQEAGAIKLTPFETKSQTELAGAQAEVMAPDFFTKIQEDLSKDKRSWRDTEKVESTATKYGISEEAARAAVQRAKLINEADKRIRQAYRNRSVTEDKVGWYVDGKLVVRKP